VGAEATCKLGNGNSIYIYDADEWGTYVFTYNNQNKTLSPILYAPGRTYTRTDADLVDAEICVNGTVDASEGYVYTTAGGANVYSTGSGVVKVAKGTQTITYQLIQDTGYSEIPITPAKLKNADGEYVETGKYTGTGALTLTYTDGRWVCDADNHSYDEETTTAPTCTTEGIKTLTCKVCGDVYVETVDMIAHTFTDAVTAPTCTTMGYTTHTCSACEYKVVDTFVDAKGHTLVVDEAVNPTATAEGKTQGLHCSECDLVHLAQTTVPALGLTWLWVMIAVVVIVAGACVGLYFICKKSFGK
jgi:hypothetical protein